MAKKPVITVNDKKLTATVDSDVVGLPRFMRVQTSGTVTDESGFALHMWFKTYGKPMYYYDSLRTLFSDFVKHQLKISGINAKVVAVYGD